MKTTFAKGTIPTNPFKTDLASRLANAEKQTIPELIAELMAPQGTVERTQMYRLFVLVELLALLKKKTVIRCPRSFNTPMT